MVRGGKNEGQVRQECNVRSVSHVCGPKWVLSLTVLLLGGRLAALRMRQIRQGQVPCSALRRSYSAFSRRMSSMRSRAR